MNERVKALRKHLRMNQTEFGARIGVAQTTIAGYEGGFREVSDAIILSMCREFDVSETWLRTGEGEMFAPLSREAEIGRLVGRLLKDREESFRSALIVALLRIPPDSQVWSVLEDVFRSALKGKKEEGPGG